MVIKPYMSAEELDLIRRAQRKDPEAEKAYFNRYYRLAVFIMAKEYEKAGLEADEDDIAEAFLKLSEALTKFREEDGSIKALIGTCVRNRARRRIYHRTKEQRKAAVTVSLDDYVLEKDEERKQIEIIDGGVESPSLAAERNNLHNLVEGALGKLSEEESEILRMNYGLGSPEMSYREIGDVYGITRQAAQQRGKRAGYKLRKIILSLIKQRNLKTREGGIDDLL